MAKPKAWISAMRLRTLPLSLSGILLGSAVALYQGFWDSLIFVLAMSTTILFQIVSNFANDFGDGVKGTDNKDRIGPSRAVQRGEISPNQMKMAVILTSILSLISASALIYFGAQGMGTDIIWMYSILAVLCVIAAILYTVGKRAYGYHGMGDLMVLIFFGGVSVLGVYSLYTKSFEWNNVNLALFSGMMSTAVLNLNNMRDYKNDAKVGKNTLVVMIGPNYAKFYHALLIICGLTFMVLFIDSLKEDLLYISLIPSVLLGLHLYKVMKTQDPKDFDPELKKVALTTFAISILFMVEIIITK